MRSDFEERRQRRIDRLRQRSEQADKASELARQAADGIARHIPLGQPILRGHHSEGRHRRDLKRIDANMRRCVEAGKQAEELSRRADAAEANTAIFSDDPDALPRLREKLAALEAMQDRMKKVNAAFRKGDAALAAMGFSAEEIAKMREQVAKGYSWEKTPYVSFQLSNNNANIRRIRERIKRLEKQESAAYEEIPFDGGRLVIDPAENRVQLFFDAKPPKEKCQALGKSGFRCARSIGAWQRHYSNAAIYYAKLHAGLPTRSGTTAAGGGEALPAPAPAEAPEKPQEAPQSPPEGPAGPPEGSAESGAGEAQAACARCEALVAESEILRADEGSPLCPECFYLYEQGDIQWPEPEQEGTECPSI